MNLPSPHGYWSSWLLGIVVVLVASPLEAAGPELKAVFPLGCGRGQSIEVALSGSQLEDGGALYFSRDDIDWEHVEGNRYRISVGPEVPLGECDVWVATASGLAGPRRFAVSDVPVTAEQVETDVGVDAQPVPLPSV